MQLLIKRPDLQELADKICRGLATNADFEKAKREDVIAIKTDNSLPRYRAGSGAVDKAARSQRYIASDETVDRMGDIIRVKGWELEKFETNPQALWAHDGRKFPVGRVTEMKKTRHGGEPALLETIKYLDEGTTPEADILWKLIDQGVIRAVSVGFIPLKWTWIEDPEERKKLGLGPWGIVFERQEQLELSNCTIPANPNALATKEIKDALRDMIKRGQITEAQAEAVVDLGEKKSIAVAFPDTIADQGAETPQTNPEAKEATPPERRWVFQVDAAGALRQVELVAGEQVKDAPPAFDVQAAMTELVGEVKKLQKQVADLTVETRAAVKRADEAVARGVSEGKVDVMKTLEAAFQRVGQRVAQESN